MSIRIERAADVTLIVTCVLVATVFGYRSMTARRAPRYADGERVEESLRKALPPTSGPKILLKLSTECEYCTLSMPAFRRVRQARTAGLVSAAIIVATHEEQSRLASFLRQNDFAPDAIIDLRSAAAKLSEFPVPYTLLLDDNGRVVHSWPGLLTESRAEEVIRAAGIATR